MQDPIDELDATVQRLPYAALATEVATLLRDAQVRVPPRMVLPLPEGASLFVMPAHDNSVAITKLITFTPANAGTVRPVIQGDVLVFELATGKRLLVLDGPTVTARRTAAVSLLAARMLARRPDGPLLIVGAGAQGRAHLEAFAEGLNVRDVVIASRSEASATALADHARAIGLSAATTRDPDAALANCTLVVTCTPANGVVLNASPRDDAFVAAIGSFTPSMVELSPALCRHCLAQGHIVVDTAEASHEAGDLLQADIAIEALPTLRDIVHGGQAARAGPVLFKSCGWAGWDLAAARLAIRR